MTSRTDDQSATGQPGGNQSADGGPVALFASGHSLLAAADDAMTAINHGDFERTTGQLLLATSAAMEMAVALSWTSALITGATAAAWTGPVGWIATAVAAAGAGILLLYRDTDYLYFAQHCWLGKNYAGALAADDIREGECQQARGESLEDLQESANKEWMGGEHGLAWSGFAADVDSHYTRYHRQAMALLHLLSGFTVKSWINQAEMQNFRVGSRPAIAPYFQIEYGYLPPEAKSEVRIEIHTIREPMERVRLALRPSDGHIRAEDSGGYIWRKGRSGAPLRGVNMDTENRLIQLYRESGADLLLDDRVQYSCNVRLKITGNPTWFDCAPCRPEGTAWVHHWREVPFRVNDDYGAREVESSEGEQVLVGEGSRLVY